MRSVVAVRAWRGYRPGSALRCGAVAGCPPVARAATGKPAVTVQVPAGPMPATQRNQPEGIRADLVIIHWNTNI